MHLCKVITHEILLLGCPYCIMCTFKEQPLLLLWTCFSLTYIHGQRVPLFCSFGKSVCVQGSMVNLPGDLMTHIKNNINPVLCCSLSRVVTPCSGSELMIWFHLHTLHRSLGLQSKSACPVTTSTWHTNFTAVSRVRFASFWTNSLSCTFEQLAC